MIFRALELGTPPADLWQTSGRPPADLHRWRLTSCAYTPFIGGVLRDQDLDRDLERLPRSLESERSLDLDLLLDLDFPLSHPAFSAPTHLFIGGVLLDRDLDRDLERPPPPRPF